MREARAEKEAGLPKRRLESLEHHARQLGLYFVGKELESKGYNQKV